jgi:hypothetical protein
VAALKNSTTSITISTPGKPDLATSLTTSTSTSIGVGGGQAEPGLLEAGRQKENEKSMLSSNYILAASIFLKPIE